LKSHKSKITNDSPGTPLILAWGRCPGYITESKASLVYRVIKRDGPERKEQERRKKGRREKVSRKTD
jgi:predicted transposase YdaD